jgi:hypothetical protein
MINKNKDKDIPNIKMQLMINLNMYIINETNELILTPLTNTVLTLIYPLKNKKNIFIIYDKISNNIYIWDYKLLDKFIINNNLMSFYDKFVIIPISTKSYHYGDLSDELIILTKIFIKNIYPKKDNSFHNKYPISASENNFYHKNIKKFYEFANIFKNYYPYKFINIFKLDSNSDEINKKYLKYKKKYLILKKILNIKKKY